MGVTNHHVENLMELGGAVLLGGAIGGPGGAAMGVAVVTTSKFVDALVTSRLGFSGPSDNWSFCSTGDCNGQ